MRAAALLIMIASAALAGCSTFDSLSAGPGEEQDPAAIQAEMTRLFDANYPPREQMGIAYFNPAEAMNVYFATDSDRLTGVARADLDATAIALAGRARNIVAEGYADERGNREYNLRLATRRALAVRDYLVSRGVDRDQIRVAAFGIEQPVAECSNESCWRRNRRVTVVYERQ